jgi:hypothetical protein
MIPFSTPNRHCGWILVAAALCWPLFACSGKPETDRPGSCTISCKSSVLGANSFKFKASVSELAMDCLADFKGKTAASMNGPVAVQFVVLDGKDRPRPNISFEPYITGQFDADKTNDDNAEKTVKDGVTTVTPFRNSGIVTPKGEWCTDSCGVAVVEVWPLCLNGADNNITVQLHSGSMISDQVSLKITNPTGAATTTTTTTLE